MDLLGTIRVPGCVGPMNGVSGAKVWYNAGDRMAPMNLCPPPPRFIGTELAFAFSCVSIF